MSNTLLKIQKQLFAVFTLLIFISAACSAIEIDKTKYIALDEIKPDMTGYALTVYKGSKVEKFSVKVLDVIRDFRPGMDRLLVMGTDERFIHTGPVQGCSGSPVFIDGRMAGALSAGWGFAKDPVYLVTPIKDMLEVGRSETPEIEPFSIPLSSGTPIDLKEIGEKYREMIRGFGPKDDSMICPLVTSLPPGVCEDMKEDFLSIGFNPVPLAGGSAQISAEQAGEMVPGGVLAVPLVWGDISLSAVGTVTEVEGEKVYGFGHDFMGIGPINLPMAAGRIHHVFSGLMFSFKIGSSGPILGTLTTDKSDAIVGHIGQQPKSIPATFTVRRFNDPQVRNYKCNIAVNRMYTPLILGACVRGTGMLKGPVPPENTVNYKIRIETEGYETFDFENTSSQTGFAHVLDETVSLVSILMNNPFRQVRVTNVEVETELLAENNTAMLWELRTSDYKVKPGQVINVKAVTENYRKLQRQYDLSLKIPDDIEPGQYQIRIAGSYEYLSFLRQSAPHKFAAWDAGTLIDSLRKIVSVKRDRLYAVMQTEISGITIKNYELAGLPASSSVLMVDDKRTSESIPLTRWIETDVYTGTVIDESGSMRIEVVAETDDTQ